MGAMDHQLGIVDEVTYGTAVTVTKFFEYDSENIAEDFRRTENDPLRTGSPFIRHDRFVPYHGGAAGTVSLAVLTKGFGYWLKHMLGTVGTTGAGPYVHTGTVGELYGDSFTLQVNRPFHPSGTNQAFTFSGGKVAEWTLSNSVDGLLIAELGLDFAAVDTATALATASYPASAEPLSWAGGVVTIGGVAVDIEEISISGSNGLNVDRRQIRGNTQKKEPTASRREGSFSLRCDFESLTQRNRAASTSQAGALAEIEATWTNGTSSLVVTLPAARFDEWGGATEGTDAIQQDLSGVVRYNGTDSPISIAYTTADATP